MSTPPRYPTWSAQIAVTRFLGECRPASLPSYKTDGDDATVSFPPPTYQSSIASLRGHEADEEAIFPFRGEEAKSELPFWSLEESGRINIIQTAAQKEKKKIKRGSRLCCAGMLFCLMAFIIPMTVCFRLSYENDCRSETAVCGYDQQSGPTECHYKLNGTAEAMELERLEAASKMEELGVAGMSVEGVMLWLDMRSMAVASEWSDAMVYANSTLLDEWMWSERCKWTGQQWDCGPCIAKEGKEMNLPSGVSVVRVP